MHVYMSIYVHAHIFLCIYIHVCTCMHAINVYLKILRTAISTTKYSAMPSQRGQSSPNILTTGTPWLALTGEIRGCLLWVKSLISYSVSITTVLHTISGLYSSALWRHSAVCTNCTALKGKKFLLTSGKGNMYWQYCGWDATKHHKIRECFSMAMSSKDLLCFAYKFRCIQSCDILHMQNIACVYNHWRLIVNISNKRFLILILIPIQISVVIHAPGLDQNVSDHVRTKLFISAWVTHSSTLG